MRIVPIYLAIPVCKFFPAQHGEAHSGTVAKKILTVQVDTMLSASTRLSYAHSFVGLSSISSFGNWQSIFSEYGPLT